MGAQCSANEQLCSATGKGDDEILCDGSMPSQAKPQSSWRGPAQPGLSEVMAEERRDVDCVDGELPCAVAAGKATVDAAEWDAMMATVNSLVGPPPGADAAPVQASLVDTETDDGSRDDGSERGSSDDEEGDFRLPWAARAAKKNYELDPEASKDDAFEQLRMGRPLYTLPEAMRADKEVVLAAITAEGAFCFNYIASEELRTCDREVGLALVASDGSLLEQLSEELRADRLIVQTAVRNSCDAIKCASKALQADKDVKAIAAAREKEEKRLMKRYMEKACGPGVTRCF